MLERDRVREVDKMISFKLEISGMENYFVNLPTLLSSLNFNCPDIHWFIYTKKLLFPSLVSFYTKIVLPKYSMTFSNI